MANEQAARQRELPPAMGIKDVTIKATQNDELFLDCIKELKEIATMGSRMSEKSGELTLERINYLIEQSEYQRAYGEDKTPETATPAELQERLDFAKNITISPYPEVKQNLDRAVAKTAKKAALGMVAQFEHLGQQHE